MKHLRFFAPCPPGAEDLLESELIALGVEGIQSASRGLGFESDLQTSYKAALYLRVASRLLLEIHRGSADSEDELYEIAKQIPWEKKFPPTAKIVCRVTGVPKDRDPRFAVLRLKDAVVDRFVSKTSSRPYVDKQNPDIRIEARWDAREAVIYFNWSGDPLHQRGYRLERSDAVLRETTAAALLAWSGWKDIAMNGGAFVDPVCGSGTLLVEAAMMALGLAPGIHRKSWGFQSWKDHDEEVWQNVRNEAAIQYGKSLERIPPILGFDIDPAAIKAAGNNIRRAALNGVIRIGQHDVHKGKARIWPKNSQGLLCADPPYGVRSRENPAELYAAIGSLFRNLDSDWQLALLAPDRKTASQCCLRAERYLSTVNGGMDVVLGIYKRHGKEITQNKQSTVHSIRQDPKAASLRKALKRNMDALADWAQKCGVSSYRIWDVDMPEFNAAVDWYEGRWLHVQEFAPPEKVSIEKSRLRFDTLVSVLKELTGVNEDALFLKTRRRGVRPYSKMGSHSERMIVREKGARFFVNFTDYLDTGLFLDHRPTRAMIRKRIGSGTFLNLFSYTGSATVMAALGGASRSVSVDVSNTYLNWCHDNLKLNQADSSRHELIRSDAVVWLNTNKDKFDLIFIDPPTYSNGYGRPDWSVQDNHAQIITLAMEHLNPGGAVIFSENFRRFRLHPSLKSDFKVKEITHDTLDPDFVGKARSHRCWLFALR